MSYIRWSSPLPITSTCTECGREPTPPLKEGDDPGMHWWAEHERIATICAKRTQEGKKPLCGVCTSPWYIYWDCMSGPTMGDQVLAIWANTSDRLPYYSYTQLKAIRDENRWGDIEGYREVGNPYNVLIEAVERWLEDVEEDFKSE